LAQKIAWVSTQRQVNLAKKVKKHDPIMTSPTKKKPKTKWIFIKSELEDFPNPLNSSLAQSAGELWCCKVLQKQWHLCHLRKTTQYCWTSPQTIHPVL